MLGLVMFFAQRGHNPEAAVDHGGTPLDHGPHGLLG